MKKRILDSNIVIRLIVEDDLLGYERSVKIFKLLRKGKRNALISIVVLQEILWVLNDLYRLDRSIIVNELKKLFSIKTIGFWEVDKQMIFKILDVWEKIKVDYTDIYLYLVAKREGFKVLTNDKDFEKLKKY